MSWLNTAIEWMFVPHPLNLCVEILTPDVIILGGEAFGEWLDHECGAFIKGISALTKEDSVIFLAPSNNEDTARRQLSMIQEASSHQTLNLMAPWSWISWDFKRIFHSEHLISNFKMLLHLLLSPLPFLKQTLAMFR